MDYSLEEFLISVIARVLDDNQIRHVAVGAASPIPGAGALLRRELAEKIKPRVSIIHGQANNPFTDGGRELFDLAGQGRIDAFFLGGVQIDGESNINLVGTGEYPLFKKRFAGSFGSAYMYFMVPTVILFRIRHTKENFVKKVDFVSAPGLSNSNIKRPGGAKWLLTELCLMSFDKHRGRFRLHSIHPGHSLSEIQDNTSFDFDIPEKLIFTPTPSTLEISLIRDVVFPEIEKTYPKFVQKSFREFREITNNN